MDMEVYVIDVLGELVAVFSLLDDKGVVHLPKPKPGWIGGRADGFGFKLFHELVGNKRADGGTHGCTVGLLKMPTLQKK